MLIKGSRDSSCKGLITSWEDPGCRPLSVLPTLVSREHRDTGCPGQRNSDYFSLFSGSRKGPTENSHCNLTIFKPKLAAWEKHPQTRSSASSTSLDSQVSHLPSSRSESALPTPVTRSIGNLVRLGDEWHLSASSADLPYMSLCSANPLNLRWLDLSAR